LPRTPDLRLVKPGKPEEEKLVAPTAWPNEIQVPDYTSEDLLEMQKRAENDDRDFGKDAPIPDITRDEVGIKLENLRRTEIKEGKIARLWGRIFGKHK